MTHPLLNRVTLLTGCASGIGAHLLSSLARAGCTCMATDLQTEAIESRAREESWDRENVHIMNLDVRSAAHWNAAVAACMKTWGRVDVLINIAGVLRPRAVVEITEDDIDAHLNTNLKGVILGTRTVAPTMIEKRTGHIINIASLAALAPVPGVSVYSASKAAVRSFSIASALELQEYGVAVSVLLPDATYTPMLDSVRASKSAALLFSGERPLSVGDIERALLHHVLPHRPLEFALPADRARLARIASVFPKAAQILFPLLRRRGLFNQTRR